MLDQLDDGSHELSLHNICCPGCEQFPNTTGILRWNPELGITYSLTFTGIHSIIGTPYYVRPQRGSPGVGRFSETDFSKPDWTANTDDGTKVHLYGVIDKLSSSQTSGTSGLSLSCSFEGTATFAVVEIPCNRMLAFENGTEEPYRLFFIGRAGQWFNQQQNVSFLDFDGTVHRTMRCSITLSESPDVALVSSYSLVKCQPSGWLAFGETLTNADCEVPAFQEQNFVSFLNGKKVAFHWADQKVAQEKIRRIYFGWVKSKKEGQREALHQPLPFMNGVSVIEYGEEVLSHLPSLFRQFVARSRLFDFEFALHPLWTALDGVLQDRLALASVSLERTVSMWKGCRDTVLSGPPASNASVWKNQSLLRSLRKSLICQMNKLLSVDDQEKRCCRRVLDGLIDFLNRFLNTDPCRGLSGDEKRELGEVLKVRINNLTGPPNSALLRRPFEDLQIPLTVEDNNAIKQRNSALHGRFDNDSFTIERINQSAEYFDHIRMLITKFVLRLCDYQGPYIDYASRPSDGNFKVKRLAEADCRNPS